MNFVKRKCFILTFKVGYTFLQDPLYKSFVRPHLDYGDTSYDKPNNEHFQNKLEKVQFRACLAITGAIQGTSRAKLYDELGLHSLMKRRSRNKLIFFLQNSNFFVQSSKFVFGFPSQINYPLRSVSASAIKPLLSRTKSFKNTFFPYCVNECNNLTVEIRNSKSVSTSKKLIRCEKEKKTHYAQSIIHSVLNFLSTLDFNLVI